MLKAFKAWPRSNSGHLSAETQAREFQALLSLATWRRADRKRASCRRHRVASIRALAAKTVLRIGDKFAGSPTCAEAPALIRDRGESVAHGDDGVGVRGAALHCVLARRYMQRGDSGKKRAKLDTRFTFRRQESLTVTESRDP